MKSSSSSRAPQGGADAGSFTLRCWAAGCKLVSVTGMALVLWTYTHSKIHQNNNNNSHFGSTTWILPNKQFLRAWVSVLATFGASEKVRSDFAGLFVLNNGSRCCCSQFDVCLCGPSDGSMRSCWFRASLGSSRFDGSAEGTCWTCVRHN